MLDVAQSQHHDISIAKSQVYKTRWIERRHGQKGFGGGGSAHQTRLSISRH
jgi:putative hydrolase of the HAD superfamily